MDSSFKDLIGKSYTERMQDEGDINPFDNDTSFSDLPLIGRPSDPPMAAVPASVCVLLVLNSGRTLTGQSIHIDNRLEVESKQILTTFNHVLQEAFRPHLRTENQSIGGFCAKSGPVQDYSMLVMGLAKVWEIEQNRSIIPWLQKKLNIDKLEKVYEIINAIEQCDDNDELKMAYNRDRELWNARRDRFQKIRNQSAHTGVVDEDNFIAYYENFCAFVERGWFTRLMNLKQMLGQ